jgi:hypothetical protein
MDDIFDNLRNLTPNSERPCSKCGLPRNRDKGSYCRGCATLAAKESRDRKKLSLVTENILTNNQKQCSRCDNFRTSYDRYCRECRREYSRQWRKNHPLTPEQRKRDSARSYTKELVKRGKIAKEPCQNCDSLISEAHHPDYNNPWNVIWLCRSCHMKHHKMLK